RGACEYFASVAHRDGPGVGQIRPVFRNIADNRDDISRFYRALQPSAADEGVRASEFKVPQGYFASLPRHVEVDVSVRIGPGNLTDRSGERDRLGGVELCRKRVMRLECQGGCQTSDPDNNDG